jgi:hypothetical protein
VKIQNTPWTPPPELQPKSLDDLIEQRIWLSTAVDRMAFGDSLVPDDLAQVAARRCQASRALCDAARSDQVKLIGNPDQEGDKSVQIPAAYFDLPRCLGHHENTVVTDLDRVTDNDFAAARKGKHQCWFNVRVETQSFLAWLRNVAKLTPAASAESNCRKWLADQMRASPLEKPKPKSTFRDEALSLFPKLGKRAFDRAWDSAIKETRAVNWSNPGAPKIANRIITPN